MLIQMQQRRAPAASWTSANPILADGEIGLETDTQKLKFGDGTTAWATLPYFSGSTVDISGKANIASPTFTGVPAAPTAAVDTNTTQIATTAFVVGQGYLKSATAASTYLTQATAASTYLTTATAAANYQPKDTDLTNIAALTGTSGFLKTDGANIWSVDTASYSPLAGSASIVTTGTVTSGTWSGSFGVVSGANLTSLTAGNLSGTIPSAVLGNSTVYIGTTGVLLNRGSAALTLAGLTLTTPTIDGIVASAAGATNALWAANTTGSISIGAGLTTGALNLAASGTSATPINIGHTNAAITLVGTTTITGKLVTDEYMVIALSDETTALTTGTAVMTFRAPFAMTLTSIPRAFVSTASSSGIPTVDIKKNGTTILGANKLTIDATEKTSVTAATATTLATTTIADDDEITFDITTAGTGTKGLKVTIYYKRT